MGGHPQRPQGAPEEDKMTTQLFKETHNRLRWVATVPSESRACLSREG
jgi:hypothetical protein